MADPTIRDPGATLEPGDVQADSITTAPPPDPREELLELAARVLDLDEIADMTDEDLNRLATLGRDLAAAPPSFVSRITAAMAEAGRVSKDGLNTEQNYKYASVEAVLAEVRRPLFERDVLLLPSAPTVDEREIRSKGGTLGTAVTVTIDFTFHDGLTDATLTVPGWKGQGQDYGDKAYGKAYTNCIKTLVRICWLLPTGDDPEADNPERVPAGAAPELPPFARKASTARKAELGAAIIPLLGRERAHAAVKSVQDSLGYFPDGYVAFAKLLEALWLERDPDELYRELLNRREDRAQAEAEAAQSAAEAPDPPASDAVTPPPDEEELAEAKAAAAAAKAAEEPDEREGYTNEDEGAPANDELELEDGPPPDEVSDPDRPAPGTVELEVPTGTKGPALVKAYRDAGCICPSPLEEGPDNRDDTCPLVGHGIPF